VINSYNKTNWMHRFLKFIFGTKLYMFQTVPLSIIRSVSAHTQQYIQVCCVCTEISASGWFYCKNCWYLVFITNYTLAPWNPSPNKLEVLELRMYTFVCYIVCHFICVLYCMSLHFTPQIYTLGELLKEEGSRTKELTSCVVQEKN